MMKTENLIFCETITSKLKEIIERNIDSFNQQDYDFDLYDELGKNFNKKFNSLEEVLISIDSYNDLYQYLEKQLPEDYYNYLNVMAPSSILDTLEIEKNSFIILSELLNQISKHITYFQEDSLLKIDVNEKIELFVKNIRSFIQEFKVSKKMVEGDYLDKKVVIKLLELLKTKLPKDIFLPIYFKFEIEFELYDYSKWYGNVIQFLEMAISHNYFKDLSESLSIERYEYLKNTRESIIKFGNDNQHCWGKSDDEITDLVLNKFDSDYKYFIEVYLKIVGKANSALSEIYPEWFKNYFKDTFIQMQLNEISLKYYFKEYISNIKKKYSDIPLIDLNYKNWTFFKKTTAAILIEWQNDNLNTITSSISSQIPHTVIDDKRNEYKAKIIQNIKDYNKMSSTTNFETIKNNFIVHSIPLIPILLDKDILKGDYLKPVEFLIFGIILDDNLKGNPSCRTNKYFEETAKASDKSVRDAITELTKNKKIIEKTETVDNTEYWVNSTLIVELYEKYTKIKENKEAKIKTTL